MNTLHLKYAVEVEKCGSITQAADNLYMAQPNLSKAIRELEESLNIVIFDRSSKGMIPTEQGRAFLASARNILAELQQMESIAQQKDDTTQRFSISIPRGSYIADGFTNFVAALDKESDIDVKVKETNSVQTVSNVVEGRFCFGIIRYQTVNEAYFLEYLREKGLRFEPIWAFEYLVLMSARHPLAQKKEIRREALAPYIEITHGDTTVPYLNNNGRNEVHEGRKRILVFERSTQFDLLAKIDTAYMWVSPIPDALLKRHDLVQRRSADAHDEYKDVLVYRKEYAPNALDRLFMDKLFEARNRVAFRTYD